MRQRKVCILSTANIKHMTLISLYTEKLDQENIMYDIIYIDKYHEVENYDGANQLYRHEIFIKPRWSFLRKFLNYWSFRKYAINIINCEIYDFIIVWNEFTIFMFSDFLKRHYKNRYCINIRDENMNRIFPVQWRYKQALIGCSFATVSSDYFKEVFPRYDYLFVHSFNKLVTQNLQPIKVKKSLNDCINLMFIGRMSFPDTMKKVIDVLGNDNRFKLSLVGTGCEVWKTYTVEKGFSNVYIRGSFKPSETANYLSMADVIYSINAEDNVHCDTLLPIKLYYAVALQIPILVFKSSYTYKYAKEHNMDIGITSLDFNRLGDVIYNKYHELDQEKIRKGCQLALKEIQKSQDELNEKIYQYIIFGDN
ncbi:MAG: hypothetical protein RR568_02750 [Anaerorhabdus sp.]|uniref:hypothetical protein n=1 Tax=Anaerorhabdus sp. TaxID=1872524 RepID=UPI002FCC81F5